jgi:hypothetical protein
VRVPINIELERRFFVLPRQKILWVPIAKSGFSSILFMLSKINGKRTRTAEASGYPEWSPEAAIHDPKIHGLSRIDELGARERKAALNGAGWWRFAVVRDPHARFLSAWLDKSFLRAPGTPHLWDGAEDVLTPDGKIDVSATFRRFVEEFSRKPTRYLQDQHFARQAALLAADVLPDLEIIPLSEFSRVARRLEEFGQHGAVTPKLNESLHFDSRRVYDSFSHSVVADIYSDDLGFDPAAASSEPSSGGPIVLSHLETECVRKLRSASVRISQLSRLAIFPRATVWLQYLFGLR